MGDYIPIEVDGVGLRNIERVEQHEYEFLIAHAGWAQTYNAPHPAASPRKSIDKRGKSVF